MIQRPRSSLRAFAAERLTAGFHPVLHLDFLCLGSFFTRVSFYPVSFYPASLSGPSNRDPSASKPTVVSRGFGGSTMTERVFETLYPRKCGRDVASAKTRPLLVHPDGNDNCYNHRIPELHHRIWMSFLLLIFFWYVDIFKASTSVEHLLLLSISNMQMYPKWKPSVHAQLLLRKTFWMYPWSYEELWNKLRLQSL